MPRVNPPKEIGVAISIMRASPAIAGSGRGMARVTSRSARASCVARSRRGSGRRTQHVLDGANARDGVLGEREGHGDGADEFAIDIDRAAAHALHDAGVFQRAAREAREDQRFLGADVFEHAEDFDIEVGDLVAGKDGASDAVHAGADLFKR